MSLCKDCGKIAAEKGKVRCHGCSIKTWQRTIKFTERQKRKAVEYMGGACQICGLKEDILDIYDFHHKNPDEKEAIMSKLFGRKGWSSIKMELDKCILLCANCHRIEHYKIRKGLEQSRLDSWANNNDWSREELETLKSMSGLALFQIELKLPRWSRKQIQEKALDIGVDIRHPHNRLLSTKELESMRSLKDEKLPLGDIAKKFRVSKKRLIQELGLGDINIRKNKNPNKNIDIEDIQLEITDYWLGFILGCARIDKNYSKLTFITDRGRTNYIRDNLLQNKQTHYNREGYLFINCPTFIRQWVDRNVLVYSKNTRSLHEIPYAPAKELFRGFIEAKLSINTGIRLSGSKKIMLVLKDHLCNVGINLSERLHKNTYHLAIAKGSAKKLYDYLYATPCDISYGDVRKELVEASSLSISIWSSEELLLLQSMCNANKSLEELQVSLPSKTKDAIIYQRNKLNLPRLRKSNPWDLREIEILKRANNIMTVEEVTREIHRSHEAVSHKAYELGITLKQEEHTPFTEDRKETLMNMKRDGCRVGDIAEKLEVTQYKIREWINLLIQEIPLEKRIEYNIVTAEEKKMILASI